MGFSVQSIEYMLNGAEQDSGSRALGETGGKHYWTRIKIKTDASGCSSVYFSLDGNCRNGAQSNVPYGQGAQLTVSTSATPSSYVGSTANITGTYLGNNQQYWRFSGTVSVSLKANTTYYLFLRPCWTTTDYFVQSVTGAIAVSSKANWPSYALSISAGTGSTATVRRTASELGAAIEDLSDGATIYRGDTLKVSFGAASGYTLATHTVNGSTFTSGGTHTVAGAVSVKATANRIAYQLSFTSSAGARIGVKRGSETLHNGSTIYTGDKLTITFSAATGYKLTSHTVNGNTFTSGNTYTVGGNVTVSAFAQVLSYTLKVTAGTGSSATVRRTESPLQDAETGTVSNGATVYYGDVLKITFGASEGYELKTHTVNDAVFTSGQSHTVTGAVSVKAAADVRSFALSISPATGTTITVQRTSSPKQGAATGTLADGAKVYYSDVLKVTFAAKTGYVLDGGTVNGETFTSGNSHTVTKAVAVKTTGHAGPSTISSLTPTSVQTQQTLSLSVSRVSTSYYHKARFYAGNTLLNESDAFAKDLSYTVPRTWFTHATDSTIMSVTVSVQTYTSSGCTTAVGVPDTKTVAVTADSGMKPALQSGFASVSADNTGIPWDGLTVYVQGYSKAKLTLDKNKITLANGATLASYKVTCQGKTTTVTDPNVSEIRTAALTGTAAIPITVTVTDSRGRTASTTLSVTPLPYAAPTLSGVKVFRCNSSGEKQDGGGWYSVKMTAACSAISTNTVTLTVARRAVGGSWSSPATIGSGSATVSVNNRILPTEGTLGQDTSYLVRFTATDKLGHSTTTTLTLPGLRWAVKFRENGQGVGFGMAPSRDKVLQIPADWSVLVGELGLVYRAGDSVTFGTVSYTQFAGGFRGNYNLMFTIPLDRPVASGVTAGVSGSIVLYGVTAGSNQYRAVNLGASGITLTTLLSPAGVTVRASWSSAPTDFTFVPNTPVGIQAYGLTVSFS